MDQQAKKHLQEEFDASLEEKDQLINVLQTQVRYLSNRCCLKLLFLPFLLSCIFCMMHIHVLL